jgi:hypothetical protein
MVRIHEIAGGGENDAGVSDSDDGLDSQAHGEAGDLERASGTEMGGHLVEQLSVDKEFDVDGIGAGGGTARRALNRVDIQRSDLAGLSAGRGRRAGGINRRMPGGKVRRVGER